MWSLILYFLFGIGQSSCNTKSNDNSDVKITSEINSDGPETGTGGDKGTVRP